MSRLLVPVSSVEVPELLEELFDVMRPSSAASTESVALPVEDPPL